MSRPSENGSACPAALRIRRGGFLLEGMNAFATTWYFYYIFFFMERRFGFGDLQNLALGAAVGFIYMFAAYYAGRLGQRHGYLNAVGLGSLIMGLSLLLGAMVHSLEAHLLVTAICTLGMCLTWPNLEALVSVHSPPGELPRAIGIYNLIWSGGGALAFAMGGALLENFGVEVIFYLPAVFFLVQTVVAWRLGKERLPIPSPIPPASKISGAEGQIESREKKRFLKLSWVANPFAYVAINTIVPVIPGLARKLELSPTMTGIFCSVFFFARTGSFLWFWKWVGWHYRWSWLLVAYLGMVLSFIGILLLENFWLLLGAQLIFGVSVGLIYYSSLFYSMDAGEDQGAHGGVHEAAVGLGNFMGPGVGAAALYFFPRGHSGTWAVTGLLALGLVMLATLRARKE